MHIHKFMGHGIVQTFEAINAQAPKLPKEIALTIMTYVNGSNLNTVWGFFEKNRRGQPLEPS